uniref:Uncharacterized protein n=1 Tax=Chrysotila carterae TaxID=13221 RepID=A0A7S4B7N0_CHRCT
MSAIGVEAHSPYTSYSQNNSTFIGDRLAEGSSASNVSLFAQRKLAALRWLSQEEARESALGEEARKKHQEIDDALKDFARLGMGVFARRSYWPAFVPCILTCGEGAPSDSKRPLTDDSSKRLWVRLEMMPTKSHQEISRTETFNKGGSGGRGARPITRTSSMPRTGSMPRTASSLQRTASFMRSRAQANDDDLCLSKVEGELLEARVHQADRYEVVLFVKQVDTQRAMRVYLRAASVAEFKLLCNRCYAGCAYLPSRWEENSPPPSDTCDSPAVTLPRGQQPPHAMAAVASLAASVGDAAPLSPRRAPHTASPLGVRFRTRDAANEDAPRPPKAPAATPEATPAEMREATPLSAPAAAPSNGAAAR